MRLDSEGTIEDIRVAVGPGGPVPFRAYEFEDFIRGRRVDEATHQSAAKTLLGEIQLRTSPFRATETYRRHLIATLFQRVVKRIEDRVVVS
jgi:carbon-monoxide dehydrogenase medium subunit